MKNLVFNVVVMWVLETALDTPSGQVFSKLGWISTKTQKPLNHEQIEKIIFMSHKFSDNKYTDHKLKIIKTLLKYILNYDLEQTD